MKCNKSSYVLKISNLYLFLSTGYLMEGALKLFPALEHAEIRSFVNGPESFTPDGFHHVSFAKEVNITYKK